MVSRRENAEETRHRRQVGEALRRWAEQGRSSGVVRVLQRHGFGTVATGQLLAGTAEGDRVGTVFEGTLDAVALPLLTSAVSTPGTANGHVTEPDAVAAGLACSGGAQLLGHPLPAPAAAALGVALVDGEPCALASTVDGSAVLVAAGPGLADVVGTLGATEVDEVALARMRELAWVGASATEQGDAAGTPVLLDVWVPVTTMLIVGRGAIGAALAAQCGLLGWVARTETELAPSVVAAKELTAADVLVLLDHGPAFDAVLVELLRSGRGFCGALGSRHTQQARRRRLRAAGITEEELARLHGPVGLDLGAATPAETAVSVVGEVLAVRRGRSGGPLATAAGRIGG
ncbi:MAG: XdhC family protein [Pseudonocardiales bacterium]|nr:XdhC family protein [Pseudonocardiales bacterium]MBV9030527.1 XdhC family protein [Pseudonocardiales bacterium]MBW0010094.1 XdhC family protein [Pseudonocardiales bacterium]